MKQKVELISVVREKMLAPIFDGDLEFWLPLFNNYQAYKEKNPKKLQVTKVFRSYRYGRNKPTLMFELENGYTDSLGWSSLVSVKPVRKQSFKYQYRKALRTTVEQDIKEFRNKNNTGRCTMCDIPYTSSNPVNVDHATPMTFKAIAEIYESTHKIHEIERDKEGSYKFRAEEHAQEFRAFHNSMATLRLICKACHKAVTYKNKA